MGGPCPVLRPGWRAGVASSSENSGRRMTERAVAQGSRWPATQENKAGVLNSVAEAGGGLMAGPHLHRRAS